MLRGLKQYTENLTAIVTVADDGGGSGMLRHDLQMPPPGDIRNCLEALANTEPLMAELLHYRFSEGTLMGQSFGNLFLAALNGISPSFDAAVSRMSEVLAITGRVLPVTNANVQLEAEFENGVRVVGESKISYCKKEQDCRIRQIRLLPERPKALSAAVKAIQDADMAARGVIRDVGRVMGLPYAEVDAIAKQVPNTQHITLSDALRLSKPLSDLYEGDENVKALIDTARKLEGMPRNASTHAAGVVITKKPVYEYVPLAKNDDAVVCQYIMTTLEELGLLKMDFLGLRNLTVLDDAVKMVQAERPGFRLEDIPEDDAPTYEMLGQGKTIGVFQMESTGMTGVCVGLKPRNMILNSFPFDTLRQKKRPPPQSIL